MPQQDYSESIAETDKLIALAEAQLKNLKGLRKAFEHKQAQLEECAKEKVVCQQQKT